MTNMIFYLIDLIASFLESLLCLQINAHMMKHGEKHIWKTIIAAVVLMSAILLMNQVQLFSMVASLVMIVCVAVISRFIYQIKLVDSLVITTAYVAVLHMTDFMVVSIWGAVMDNPNFLTEMVQGYSALRGIYVITAKGLMVGVYLLIVKKIVPQFDVAIRKMAGAVIACFFLVWYFANMTFETTDESMVVIWGGLLIVAMAGIYLVSEYTKWKQAKNEYELATAHNRAVSQIYEELSQNYAQNRILYHDMNNHYMAIRGYLENAEYQKATEYLERINGAFDQTLVRWTGIQVLDMLLNYKVAEAQKNGIGVDVISDQLEMKLSDHEVTALFGNAMDNAMEACQKLESGLKWIKVVIRRVNGMTFIKISNPYVTIQMNREGKLVTTKADSSGHGLGTKGMELIVEKYKGTLQYRAENNVFILEIAFFD